ncbi:molybdenum cofactor guanylyltransferase [Bacillus nakamurai]|uniref:molybdenum cofactor guanylyltransferase n=1 Tax=Bacillus nakamurai TaxID=1793963 RepID=UPI0020C1C2A6|nr:molybdenum cofactor guanylyltransferase [Bacillus nakamurai]MCP6683149.1 molybdenum cofactor guanylyltransferase [Bacillus nakamurai]
MKQVNVLLAGGASRRFGEPKAFVKWKGKMFYERAKSAFGSGNSVIICRPEHIERFTSYKERYVFPDLQPFRGMGPLAGIYTAMEQMEGESYTVISCDTPLVSRRTMASLEMRLTGGADAVIPVCGKREQPLIAVYHKRVKDLFFDQLTQNQLRMADTLRQLSVCYVQAEEIGAAPEEFLNINTQDDYIRLLAHIESSNQD